MQHSMIDIVSVMMHAMSCLTYSLPKETLTLNIANALFLMVWSAVCVLLQKQWMIVYNNIVAAF